MKANRAYGGVPIDIMGLLAFPGVYSIHSKTADRIYIGASKFIAFRIAHHSASLYAGKHLNADLQKDYDLYGFDDFVVHVLEQCEADDVFEAEKTHVKDALNNGFDLYNHLLKPTIKTIRPPTDLELSRIRRFSKILEREDVTYGKLAKMLNVSKGTLWGFVNNGYIPQDKKTRGNMALDDSNIDVIFVPIRRDDLGRFT